MVLALKEASRSPPFLLEIAVSLFAASIEAAKLPLVDESSVVPSILLSESRLKFAVDLATLKVKPETSAESTSREVGFLLLATTDTFSTTLEDISIFDEPLDSSSVVSETDSTDDPIATELTTSLLVAIEIVDAESVPPSISSEPPDSPNSI